MIQLLGLAILLAATASALFALTGVSRRWREQQRLRKVSNSFFIESLARLRLRAERSRTAGEGAWSGYRKFSVTRRRPETSDACTFFMKPHDGFDAPPFRSGQFLTFRLTTEESKQPIVRCYSLSGPLSPEGEFQITVKRINSPPDKPDAPPGTASAYFHEKVHEGDIVDVAAPRGLFTLEESKGRPLVLIAGGVGITPILAMLEEMAAAGDSREIVLFYGVRNSREHIAHARLNELASQLRDFRSYVFYSHRTDECKLHIDYDHAGRITTEAITSRLPSANYEFYLCGPPAMLDDLITGLKEWGVHFESLRYEAFGGPSVKKRRIPPPPESPARNIVLAKTGQTIQWTADQGSILDVCESKGIMIESGCRAGNCGVCAVPVREGEVSYISRPSCEVERASCLTCCSIPSSPTLKIYL